MPESTDLSNRRTTDTQDTHLLQYSHNPVGVTYVSRKIPSARVFVVRRRLVQVEDKYVRFATRYERIDDVRPQESATAKDEVPFVWRSSDGHRRALSTGDWINKNVLGEALVVLVVSESGTRLIRDISFQVSADVEHWIYS